MSDNSPLERYVAIKEEIGKLEDELDLLKEKVYQAVDEAGGKIDDDRFTLKTQKRPKYKFSSEYEAKNKELKALKKDEIESGAATVDGYSEYVTVKIKD